MRETSPWGLRWWCVLLWLASASLKVSGVELEGFTEPYRQVDIAASTPAVLVALHVKEGDAVTADQVVAELDHRVLSAQLAVAKARMSASAGVEAAQARYALRRERFKQLDRLAARGNARPDEVARARMERSVAAAELKRAREEMRLHRRHYEQVLAQREQRRLRSPVDGRVIEVHREVAELVAGSEGKVVTVAVLDPLRLTIFVPHAQLDAVKPGDAVVARIPGHAMDLEATVELVSPVVDAESGTGRVHLVVPNPQLRVRSGMRATVALPMRGE